METNEQLAADMTVQTTAINNINQKVTAMEAVIANNDQVPQPVLDAWAGLTGAIGQLGALFPSAPAAPAPETPAAG